MRSGFADDAETVRAGLARIEGRLRVTAIGRHAARVCLVCTLLLLVVSLGDALRVWPFRTAPWSLVAWIGAIAVWTGVRMRRRRTLASIARFIDARLGLHDEMRSACSFVAAESPSPFVALHVMRAARRMRAIDPTLLCPVVLPSHRPVISLVTMLAAIAWLSTGGTPAGRWLGLPDWMASTSTDLEGDVHRSPILFDAQPSPWPDTGQSLDPASSSEADPPIKELKSAKEKLKSSSSDDLELSEILGAAAPVNLMSGAVPLAPGQSGLESSSQPGGGALPGGGAGSAENRLIEDSQSAMARFIRWRPTFLDSNRTPSRSGPQEEVSVANPAKTLPVRVIPASFDGVTAPQPAAAVPWPYRDLVKSYFRTHHEQR